MDLEGALRTHFDLSGFRPLQREIIETVLAGNSAMAILPTGGGKSLCYQLPALLLDGVTLVISPLISLMKDQVDGLVERGIAAVAINSQDTAAEGRQKLEQLSRGEVKLAFVAPERLKNTLFLDACHRVKVSLLAVDEAHCVSQWGHDFRPDYRYIKDFRQMIGSPPLLALTATARPQVERDVTLHLGIEEAPVFRGSADRPNLWLGVEPCQTVAEKRAKVAHLARASGGSTIIYVSSRKDAESLAAQFESELGEPVAPYHAGLTPVERTGVQNRFMTGLCRVVVATNAFGMGIDKPDIRAVIHAGVPDSLEAYFQEVGRAGRDGLPAACSMVILPGMDVKVREFLLQREQIDTGAVDQLFGRIADLSRSGTGWLHSWQGDDPLALLVISHLQAMGCVEPLQSSEGGMEVGVARPLTSADRSELHRRLQEHERQRLERFRQMKRYVYRAEECRRQQLLRYFGEPPQPLDADCCSTCHPRPLPGDLPTAAPAGRKSKARPAAVQAEPAAPAHPEAARLLERLKRWRRARATEMQVPAYVVFGDRDLEGIAAAAPLTLDQLAACRGIGPRKLATYGPALLAEIQAGLAEAEPGTEPGAPAEPGPAPPEAEPAPPRARSAPAEARLRRYELLARAAALFASGTAPTAVAQALGRPERAAWRLFFDWLAAEGSDAWRAVVRQVLSPDDYRAIRAALQACGEAGLEAVYHRLEGRYSYEQILTARLVLIKSGQG
ncbi:MAG: RecQ family ATP-dependent DNA helicase [Bacillota bacterium]